MSQEVQRAAMEAASGEVSTPLASADVLAPAKRENESWSEWSTLPGDLVRRIADSFLDNNDLDYYMCFRGVCPSWRAATKDPKKDTLEPSFRRFQPLDWIILEEDFHGDGMRVLLNTATGRFLCRKLPLLLDYYVVGTSSGFFVLADRSPPHAASIFNPFTGYMVRYAASVPPDVGFAAVLSLDRCLGLALFCDSSRKIHTAGPETESFFRNELLSSEYFRKAAVGGVFYESSRLGEAITYLDTALPKAFPCGDGPYKAFSRRLFLVGLAKHLLVVFFEKLELGGRAPQVYKSVDTKTVNLVPMRFKNHSIFIGDNRCLVVNTDIFPSIEANCVYYTEISGSSAHICKCNTNGSEVQRISQAADFVKQANKFVLVGDPPFSVIQRLSNYTINNLDSQLTLQQMT